MSMLAKLKPVMEEKNYSLYRALRELRRFSRTNVALAIGVSYETLGRTERGEREPTKEEVMAMDKKFGCNGELIRIWLGNVKLSSARVRQVKEVNRVITLPDTRQVRRFKPWNLITPLLGGYFLYELLKGVWL